jgi:hypothetical protein
VKVVIPMIIVDDIELAANIKGDKKNEFLRSKTDF